MKYDLIVDMIEKRLGLETAPEFVADRERELAVFSPTGVELFRVTLFRDGNRDNWRVGGASHNSTPGWLGELRAAVRDGG